MTGPCAKARVICHIVTPEGRVFAGTNDVANPQRTCPRGAESQRNSYGLCRDLCKQPGHAEIIALKAAGPWAVGATALISHWRCCPACESALEAAGVVRIETGMAL